MGRETQKLKTTEDQNKPSEIQLLECIRTNQPIGTIKSFINNNPQAIIKIIGYPYYKPILYIACNELSNTINPEIVNTLIDLGADLHYSDDFHNNKEALHFAALSCNPKILKVIINRLGPDKINLLINGNTVLHFLVKEGDFLNPNYGECIKLLVKAGIDINKPDKNCNTALHFSVRYGSRKQTLDLLRVGASLVCKNKSGLLPIEKIDGSTLETHLDECLEVFVSKNINLESFTASYNYRTLMPQPRIRNKDNTSKNIEDTETGNKLITIDCQQLASETQVISYISKSSELRHLLKHPVITSFLYIKWHRIRWFFYTNLAFHIIFCLSLILYIVVVYSNQSKNEHNGIDSMLLVLLGITFNVLVLREFFQIVVTPTSYFCSFQNLLDLFLVTLTAIILFQKSPTKALRKQVSASAILMVAFDLVIIIGQHPKMSTNIVMLRTVSLNFFKFLLWYSILILAFSLSFYTLFKDTDNETQQLFRNPGVSLFKTLVMLTGEFDLDSIDFQVYPFTSHIVFILFVFMIAIILFNLLNGLAVSDTQRIKSNSELVGLIARTEYIEYMERMLLARVISVSFINFIQKYCCCLPKNIVNRFIMPDILIRRICIFPYFLKDYRLMIYPNQQAKVILTNMKCTDEEVETCLTDCYNIYLDRQTTKRTKQLIKMKKENLEEKRREKRIADIQQKEQQAVLDKLDYLITNMNILLNNYKRT